MAINRYQVEVSVTDEEYVYLKVIHPQNYTESETDVDLPGDNDFVEKNEFTKLLGKGIELKKGKTIINSVVSNLDNELENVKINYLINDGIVVEHNKKVDDLILQSIKIRMRFK